MFFPFKNICCMFILAISLFSGCSNSEDTSGEKREKADKPFNVIIFTLDTTRADSLGCYGNSRGTSPNIDKLAKEGVVFEKCFAPAPLTLPSHASIMTGKYPYSHKVRNNGTYVLSDKAMTVAEILKNKGYKTKAIIASFPLDSQYGLNQGFDDYDDNLMEGGRNSDVFFQERDASVIATRAVKWISSNKEEQFFLWLHFFDPHMPYNKHSVFGDKYSDKPYLGEVAYLDLQIGRVVEALEECQLKEETLLVFVGDHGESLNEHGEDSHGFFTYNSTLHVPFIMNLPGLIPSARRVEKNTTVVDIFPTVLKLCNISTGCTFDGKDLSDEIFGTASTEDSRSIYFESYLAYENFGWNKLQGIITDNYKFIKTTRNELYNIEQDWREEKNIIKLEEDKSAGMEELLALMLSDDAGSSSENVKALSPAEMEKLKSLGYLGAGTAFSGGNEILQDPKDMIKVLKYIKAGEFHFSERDWESTLKSFGKVLEVDENNVYALTMTGKTYANMGDIDKAEKYHLKALNVKPDFYTAMTNLAAVYSDNGKEKEALELCRKVLNANPCDPIALTAMGSAYEKQGNLDDAVNCYEKALGYDPYFQENMLKLGNLYSENGQYSNAEKILSEYLEMNPDDFRTKIAIGAVYFKVGLNTKTIEYFQNILKEKPNKLIAYYYIGLSNSELGNRQEARKYLKVFVENWRGKEVFLNKARKVYEKL